MIRKIQLECRTVFIGEICTYKQNPVVQMHVGQESTIMKSIYGSKCPGVIMALVSWYSQNRADLCNQ